jgi:membrane protease YdiL (CAAX protease family)
MELDPRRRSPLIWFAYVFEGGLALVAWALGLLFNHPIAELGRWDGRALSLGIACSLPMLAGFFACVRWPVGPLRTIKQFADEAIYPLFAPCTLPELATLSFLAGLGEEALFRGLIQGLLGQWLGPAAGLILASILFGLLHFITPTYALLAGLIGVYLGAWYLATENLVVVIVAHGFYDFVALAWLARGKA